jgi:GT2 family glycosyltransferase
MPTMQPPRVDVTVVSVSHDHWADLREALPRTLGPAERCSRQVIVVDNACADGTAAHVLETFPEAEVIRNARALGFAANCNQAIASSRGRYVLLLNPDVRCAPGSIDALVRFMDAHPEAGAAGPKLLNPNGSLQLSCRRFSTPFLFLLRGLGFERWLERYPPQRRALMQDWDHASVLDVDWVLGAALIVRRETIEDVGPLDPAYFLYCEDQDWCYRMWTRGWSVYYVPDSTMTHAHRRASSGSLLSRWKWIHVRSTLRMFRKQGTSGRRPVTSARRTPDGRSAA